MTKTPSEISLKNKERITKTVKKTLGEEIYDKLTRVSFTLDGKNYEIDFGEEILINKKDIHSQVERLPAIIGYLGSIIGTLEQEFKDRKILKDKVEALLDKKIRMAGIDKEKPVERSMRRNPKWTEVSIAINETGVKLSRAKAMLSALHVKHSVLISRSADIRATPSDSIVGVSASELISVTNEDFYQD
jgi:hypothetical protein